jgi:hypothetical protein
MLALEQRGFRYFVTSVAGGAHSFGSLHYSGRAFDIDEINGVRISGDSALARRFMSACREVGAIEVFGPSNDPSGHFPASSASSPAASASLAGAARVVNDVFDGRGALDGTVGHKRAGGCTLAMKERHMPLSGPGFFAPQNFRSREHAKSTFDRSG